MYLSQFADNSEGSRTPEKKQGERALAPPHTSEKQDREKKLKML